MLRKLAPLSVILLLLLVDPTHAASRMRRPLPLPYSLKVRPRQLWCAHKHQMLKSALGNWAKHAGWTMQWDASHDYPIVATVCFNDSFMNALQGVSQAYRDAEYPLYLDLYPKQRLLVISQ